MIDNIQAWKTDDNDDNENPETKDSSDSLPAKEEDNGNIDDHEMKNVNGENESNNENKKDSEKTLFKLRKWLSFNKSSD